jgi:hypothetical protein
VRGRGRGQALSWGRSLPSPVWTLVTPYCKRTRPGRGTNTKAAGFPPLSLAGLRPPRSFPPFALAHALDPSGLGHAAHSLVGLGTPRSRNADKAAGLNEEEMALIIKRFKTAIKGRKEHPKKNKTKGKRSCFKLRAPRGG